MWSVQGVSGDSWCVIDWSECVCVCVCVCICLSSSVCMVGVIFVYVDTVYGFYGYSFLCLVGCFSMIIWTPTVLSVLYASVLYFCIWTCSAQLSMFQMERGSRNMLIIIIIIMWIVQGRFKVVLLTTCSSGQVLTVVLLLIYHTGQMKNVGNVKSWYI